jgi:hypothetical protein
MTEKAEGFDEFRLLSYIKLMKGENAEELFEI